MKQRLLLQSKDEVKELGEMFKDFNYNGYVPIIRDEMFPSMKCDK